MIKKKALTNPQKELLLELPTSSVRGYAPAQRLVADGLACWRDEDSDMLEITPAGEERRAAFAQEDDK